MSLSLGALTLSMPVLCVLEMQLSFAGHPRPERLAPWVGPAEPVDAAGAKTSPRELLSPLGQRGCQGVRLSHVGALGGVSVCSSQYRAVWTSPSGLCVFPRYFSAPL